MNEMTEKLTQSELFQMFGGEIPMEAVNLIFDGPSDMTIGECREKLKLMAQAHKSKTRGEMIHRVAKAIFEKMEFPDASEAEAYARAAVGAMKDPPMEMLQASYEAMFLGEFKSSDAVMIGAGFDAAIDEALK